MVDPNRIINWIEENLEVTQGANLGEPFKLQPWQKRFIRGAFRVNGDSALSVSRGAGKSTTVAAIVVACLIGPLQRKDSQVIVVASSFQQGKIIFRHVVEFLEAGRNDLSNTKCWRKTDNFSTTTLTHKASGAEIRVIGSDPRRAHGLAPYLVLCDEPAQWPPGTGERMYAALTTSIGKIPGGRLIALGTRPSDSDHWFQRMLDGGAAYAQNHSARPGDPPFRRSTWRRANPSLDIMPSLISRIKIEAENARKDVTLLPQFEALRLNAGTPDTIENFLLEAKTWNEIEGDTDAKGDYVLGVDLGTSAAYSGAAAYWPDGGRLDSFGVFPQTPELSARGVADGVGSLYTNCHRRGELLIAGDRVSDVSSLLEEVLLRWGTPGLIVCDRWREAELYEKLNAIGFPLTAVETRGQGFKDGGEDVRMFRQACLGGKVVPKVSLLLRHAMASVRVVGDTAGNWKIGKKSEGGRKQTARDDAAAAAVLAVSAGVRHWNNVPTSPSTELATAVF